MKCLPIFIMVLYLRKNNSAGVLHVKFLGLTLISHLASFTVSSGDRFLIKFKPSCESL